MSDLIGLLLILATLVGMSAFFSGTEVAMFSLRLVDREHLRQEHPKLGKRILAMLKRPQRLIANILVGNEFVNVSVSVVVASIVARTVGSDLSEIGKTFLTTGVALPLLLLFGEIIPKTIAYKGARKWSRVAVRPLWIWGTLVLPVRFAVVGITKVLTLPFGAGASDESLSEAEFRSLVDEGSAQGQVEAHERRIIHSVFEFGEKKVGDVMQAREQVFALSYELPVARLTRELADRGFSRVPIYQRRFDNILGILHAKDLVVQATGNAGTRPLSELLHAPIFVPRTLPCDSLFRTFKKRKSHMAVVVNEYGRVDGLVTMEDLLEELFGEIYDERAALKGQRVDSLETEGNS